MTPNKPKKEDPNKTQSQKSQNQKKTSKILLGKKNEEKKGSKTQSPTDLLQTAVLATKWKWQHQKHTPAQVLCSIFIFYYF
jgi:hypothetical protein